nr:MAG TPA: hypothetical protein [Caudoviricetes sp.]
MMPTIIFMLTRRRLRSFRYCKLRLLIACFFLFTVGLIRTEHLNR